jgi:hypothetical protein
MDKVQTSCTAHTNTGIIRAAHAWYLYYFIQKAVETLLLLFVWFVVAFGFDAAHQKVERRLGFIIAV